MGFIVTTLPFWNNKYCTHLMHRAGICYKYCARAFLPGKVWKIIDDGVRGQNALVRSVSLPKKAPLWTHPRFSLSSVHSLWCASRKRSSKTHSALHGYNFLMKSPNTFWQKYFLRKKKSLWESRKFLTYQSGKTINKKGKPQVCQNFHFCEDQLFLCLCAGLCELLLWKLSKSFWSADAKMCGVNWMQGGCDWCNKYLFSPKNMESTEGGVEEKPLKSVVSSKETI